MELNPIKWVVIHVIQARTPVPKEYLLHGHFVESVGCSKYLGVEISDNLSYNNHIQKICTSASRSLGFLKHNIRTKSLAIHETVYKTVVCQSVEYSSSVWSPYTQNNMHKIEMVQRRAARWTLDNYTRQGSVSEMLNHLV